MNFLTAALSSAQSDSLRVLFNNGEPATFAFIRSGNLQYFTDHRGVAMHSLEQGVQFEVAHINGNDTFLYDTMQYAYIIRADGMLLPEQKVGALPTRALFSKEFAGFPVVESPTRRIKRAYGLLDMGPALKQVSQAAQPGMVLSGPITYFYEKYSKDAASRREYARLENLDANRKRIEAFFNSSRIQTLLPDCIPCQESREQFRNYCSLHPKVMDQLSEIELLERIRRCGNEIIAQHIILNELWSDVHYPIVLPY